MDIKAEYFENSILQIANKLIEEYQKQLEQVGLKADSPELNRGTNHREGYQSELCIYFSDKNGICDVLEFFIYQKGKRSVFEDDVETWLKNNIDDVINVNGSQK